MSFRGRGGGGGRGGRGGGSGRGGGFRGGGGRGGRGGYNRDQGPPETVIELGEYVHPCESDIVCKCTNEKVPYFNAPVFLENKQQIGKVDEIFGPIKDFYFSVKLSDSMKAKSFSKATKFFIDPYKLLPLQRFLPQPKGAGVNKRGGRGGGRGGRGDFRGRGGRGGFGRGRGGGFGRGGGGRGGGRGGGGGFRGRGR
ncbi:hypothetical protein SNE40_005880 [Patella caerulea]|uniref:H/ACA ribonucleoprotein complex subunit n=1 Tax=Patella caerulea TaxID=87958 RepID=A0AAN8QC69_PATCE